ncbi:phage tail tape measure protein [Paenarthrobacter nitroguajacolicus]|uniref:phage tail tape measure protein n=1 Tax=Paenarthrobacter nitroguajacolicus TaxID=211146 RepID=UPI003AE23851
MSERSVVVRIRAEIGDFRRQMDQAAEAAARTGKAASESGEQASTGLGRLVSSAKQHEQSWSTAGTALMGFGAAVVAGVGLAIAKYAEFDKAMSEVRAATHASAGDMDQLRNAAVKAGADTSFSAKEAADAITELAKAGVSTADILNGGLNGALSLAAAGSMDVAGAAELAATAMTQFKLKGNQLPHVADLLAAGAGKAQGSVEDLGMALKQGGLVASATGLSIEETTGGLAAFASAGLIGSDAGTSFKTMLQGLTPNSAAAATKMSELGISAYDSQGKFIGLSKFAGVLQTSMKNLTPEARSAAMEIIFGSDAVRAANVLYEQGAEGITEWTNKVNDAGFAASTAAIKQDNLAGDLEKLGGSFDTVLIKGGSGAATALRGIVQSAEDLIDAIGSMDPEMISLIATMAGVVGGAALVGGAFLKVAPAAIDTVSAFKNLGTEGSKVPGTLGRITKAAGGAVIAFGALQIAGNIFTESKTKSTTEFANAMMKVSEAGQKAKASDLDTVFQGFGKAFGMDTVANVNGTADAIARLNKTGMSGIQGWEKDVNQFFDGFTGMWGQKSELGQIEDRLKSFGETLGSVASTGGAASAAKSFKLLSDEFERNGKTAKDALDKMPGYRDALMEAGQAAGLALEPHELLELAVGKIPDRMAAATASQEQNAKAAEVQAQATEEAQKRLEDMGLSAQGAIDSLSKLLDKMFQTGLATLSARDAESAYQAALDGLKVKIDEVTASQTAGNAILDAATGSFDLTSEAGRSASAVFGDVAQKAISTTTAMANNGATQAELQAKLGTTYQSLYDTARAFGASEEKADDLARSALNIPKGVPIETAVQNYADTMAKLNGVKGAIDAIPKYTHSQIDVLINERTIKGTQQLDQAQNGGPGGASGGQVAEILGFYDGGRIPFPRPADMSKDNVLGLVNGKPIGLQGQEWIINGRQSDRNDHWLRAVNDGLNLDDAFAAAYQAPSKSLAAGYGSSMGYAGSGGVSAGLGMSVNLGDTHVQVLLDGQELRHTMRVVAGQVVTEADANANRYRKGR